MAESLVPASPYFTTHARNNSSISFTLSPRPTSPSYAYSPFSAASESSPFLPPPISSRQQSPLPSPGLGKEFTHFLEVHSPRPSTSKRWLLLGASALLVLFFAAWSTVQASGGLSGGWAGLREELSSRIHQWGDWGGQATGKSWTEEVHRMDELIKQAREQATGVIAIDVGPTPRMPEEGEEVKYLGYLPHSGYHNQREEFVQALILGKMLNRTVLVPPVWIGWPSPWSYYPILQETWNQAILMNEASFGIHATQFSASLTEATSTLYAPANFSNSHGDYPLPGSELSDPDFATKYAESKERSKAKWEKAGYQVRPDGWPITHLTAQDCKSYSPECRHTYKDTFLAWDSLVSLNSVADDVKLVDRWDLRENSLQELLGLESQDFFVFQDEVRYDFTFTDPPPSTPPLPLISTHPDNSSRYARMVSVPAMRELPHKVLLIGSLFGYGRVVGQPGLQEHDPLPEKFAQAMAFDNPWLVRPANEIRDRLGGGEGYVGVHARVGDGVFARQARQHMETTWRELVARLGVEEGVTEEMWQRIAPPSAVVLDKRELDTSVRLEEQTSDWAHLDGEEDGSTPSDNILSKHAPAHYRRAPVPSASLRNLTCRSPLHTDPTLVAFNTPLYLATDSRSPETDLNLAIFFASFPCTFVLADFDRPSALNGGLVVESVGDMAKLINKADGVPLGRLFLPFLEAIIAAKGSETVGTPGSTFSIFAQGALHDAYRDQPNSHPTKLDELEDEPAITRRKRRERRGHSARH